MDQKGELSHTWVATRLTPVDGNPNINPYKGVGNLGFSLVMLVNELTRRCPNTIFKMDHIVVAKRRRKGQELLINYGSTYESFRRERVQSGKEQVPWRRVS